MSSPGPEPDGEQRRVLEWAAEHRRDLPWRRTRDPWAVLVSEVMLQQTQVERVEPRWRAFLDRWPSAAACAAAPLSEVLVEWQGLGYPRRARALHETAQLVQDVHGGRFPDDLDTLLTLPGVGPYTARAVLAFAFEADVAVLDTNVGRILARRDGSALSPRSAQRRADEWLPAGEGWAWNQALLDVGARHCRPGRPLCSGCPVAPGVLVAPGPIPRSRPGDGISCGVAATGAVRGVGPPGEGPRDGSAGGRSRRARRGQIGDRLARPRRCRRRG